MSHYRHIRNFKNRSFGVFINCDYRACAFHSDDVLNSPADPERKIQLGRNGLAGGADLAVHGEPAVVADGAGGGEFSAEGGGELLGEVDVFLFLDAAAHGDDDFGLGEVDSLFGFLEPVFRVIAGWVEGDSKGFYWRGGRACFRFVSAKCSVLERGDPRVFRAETYVGGEFSLEHLASEEQLAGIVLVAGAVADDAAA